MPNPRLACTPGQQIYDAQERQASQGKKAELADRAPTGGRRLETVEEMPFPGSALTAGFERISRRPRPPRRHPGPRDQPAGDTASTNRLIGILHRRRAYGTLYHEAIVWNSASLTTRPLWHWPHESNRHGMAANFEDRRIPLLLSELQPDMVSTVHSHQVPPWAVLRQAHA